jgi:putative serine protease PepD
MKSSLGKIAIGFVLGSVVAGGVATAAGTFSGSNVVKACVDNRTNAIYATSTGSCPTTRTLVTLGDQSAPVLTNNASNTTAAPTIKSVVAKVSPSVVTVNVTTSTGGDTGSGSILKSNSTTSWIITNNHVIDAAAGGAGTISVELDNGDDVDATIVGRDTNYDLAVLKINRGNLPVLALGDSSSLAIGDPVIAFGSPLGLDHTVTSGIVSSLNRPVTTGTTGAESYVDAIQTDAAINPGNSGGALTDGLGRIVGVNSAIASLGSTSLSSQSGNIGLGFAIPINEAMRVFNEIVATGHSTRPVLGVYFDNTYTGKGAKILKLTTGATPDAAEKAGIVAGSIITSIDGTKITDQVSAIVKIRSYAPGATVSVTVTPPGGGSKTFTVTLGSAVSN